MPRVTRNSTRLATSNGSSTTETIMAVESTQSSISARTRSQIANQNEESTIVRRRSTRRAAMEAKTRIAEAQEAERRRRSRRVASRNNRNSVAAMSQERSSSDSVFDSSRFSKSGEKQPAVAALKSAEDSGDDDLSQLQDFTCAICLDKPDKLEDLATISGCTHKFCFDCIDKWAETENKCPCCKARFRTITRVKNLPPLTPPQTRRGKRKRSDNTNNSGSNTRRRTSPTNEAAASTARVNSRTVEDRNQQSLPAGFSMAVLESILGRAFQVGGTGGRRGTTTFRFPIPANMAEEESDINDIANMLRSVLQSATNGGGAPSFSIQAVQFHSGAPPAAGAAAAASGRGSNNSNSNGGGTSASPPRGSASSNSDSRSRRQRQSSTIFSYFSSSPNSRRNPSSRSSPARSSSAVRSSVLDDDSD